MDKDNRRTIEELIARYQFEPELRDIYVEGNGDKLLLEWFLRKLGCRDVSVFEIDCVDIPNQVIQDLKLEQNNRDEVIALSLLFHNNLKDDCDHLICIADSDYDFLLGRKHDSRYLIYTDYTSMDLYFCSASIVEKVLMLGVRKIPCDVQQLFDNLIDVLQKVFLVRATNVRLGWNLEWNDFRRCCSIRDNFVIIDCDELINRYLSKNARRSSKPDFIRVYTGLKAKALKDFRHRIRGHDFLTILGWYIAKHVREGGNKYNDPNIIRAMIFPAIDMDHLVREPLFSRLLSKYKS